jgi:hypothetical protein
MSAHVATYIGCETAAPAPPPALRRSTTGVHAERLAATLLPSRWRTADPIPAGERQLGGAVGTPRLLQCHPVRSDGSTGMGAVGSSLILAGSLGGGALGPIGGLMARGVLGLVKQEYEGGLELRCLVA